MSWTPLLTGEAAGAAAVAVEDIVRALRERTDDSIGPSYASGHAGIALLHGYHAAARPDSPSLRHAEARLARAFDLLAEETHPAGFFVGFAGVAWASHHLEELLTGRVTPGRNEEVDEVLAQVVGLSPWTAHFDLVYGLAGLGCYALDHPDRSLARRLVDAIVERLDELAEPRAGGVSWLTPPHLIPREDLRLLYPEGYHGTGMAHGAAGVLGMLARAHASGLAADRAGRLLSGAVRWLLANRRPDDGGSTFPPWVAGARESCRSAWCFGDPGVSVALLSAARALGRASWEAEALEIARRDSARPFEETQVRDPMFCHGAAGLGHLYNRMYQATGDEVLRSAALRWFERALSMHRPGEGIAGYASWWPEAGEWHTEPGLLTGAAGLGLALLATTSTSEPGWDRPLLCRIESR